MSNTTIKNVKAQPEGLAAKRPYRQPKLQIFGKVLHLTQGVGSAGFDHATLHHHHHKK